MAFGKNKRAMDAENKGYEEAQGYMNPYTEHAGDDFDAGRNALYKGAQSRMNGQHYNADHFGLTQGMTPDQLLTNSMKGYNMSPMAQEEMQYSMAGANNARASEGMYGSGDNQLEDAEIGNTISNQDMSNYLKSKSKAYGVQTDALHDYNKQNKEIIDLFHDMLGTEDKASTKMADLASQKGRNEANIDTRGAHRSPLNEIASLGGLGFGMYEGMNRGSGMGGGTPNFSNPYEHDIWEAGLTLL